jgi:hypothetical protein
VVETLLALVERTGDVLPKTVLLDRIGRRLSLHGPRSRACVARALRLCLPTRVDQLRDRGRLLVHEGGTMMPKHWRSRRLPARSACMFADWCAETAVASNERASGHFRHARHNEDCANAAHAGRVKLRSCTTRAMSQLIHRGHVIERRKVRLLKHRRVSDHQAEESLDS